MKLEILPNSVLGLPRIGPTTLFPIGQEKFLELDPFLSPTPPFTSD
jgi:hypothetical protein